MRISKNTLFWICGVFAFKLAAIGISACAHFTNWGWVPPSSLIVLAVALAFVLSSLVFLNLVPKLGLASTAVYGALTFYGAITSIVVGKYFVWSLFAALTGLALVGFAIFGWRQLDTFHPSTES